MRPDSTTDDSFGPDPIDYPVEREWAEAWLNWYETVWPGILRQLEERADEGDEL